jgi:hypothetical protein
MPALRSSTLKQRTNPKTQKTPVRTRIVRRKIARSLPSLPLSQGLGTLSYLPYELRQAIFELVLPPETPPAATADSFGIVEKDSGVKGPPHVADTPKGRAALLCTSKAISTEVKRSCQNREYQLSLSTFGIVFEGLRSAVAIECWCDYTLDRRERPCNHRNRGLSWKVAGSKYSRSVAVCSALKGLKSILPAMRRLHITLTNDTSRPWIIWRYKIADICKAGRIWEIVQKAELAGVELRITLQLPNYVPRWHFGHRKLKLPLDVPGLVGGPRYPRVVPLQYESKTKVKGADRPRTHGTQAILDKVP